MNQKRLDLIELSQIAKVISLKNPEEFPMVNDAIKFLYMEENPGITEFRTFKEWKTAGYHIIKGSKSFPVWARPIKAKPSKDSAAETAPTGKEDSELKKYKYWPICYLFSNEQVTQPEPEREETESGDLDALLEDAYFRERVN